MIYVSAFPFAYLPFNEQNRYLMFERWNQYY